MGSMAGGGGDAGSGQGGMMGAFGLGGAPPTDKSLKVAPGGSAPVVPLVDMRSTPVNTNQISALQQKYYQGLGG